MNVPAKTTARAFCEMSMKPPQPLRLAAELAGIDVAEAVAFGHAEAGQVETAAMVEIEHLVLIEDRVSVCR